MSKNDVINDYFEWLYNIVCNNNATFMSYRKLLMYLHSTPFKYVISKDENRANDGVKLRNRYASDFYNSRYIDECLDEQCSVLEMMIALAFKMENIMDNPQIGDRTAQWFWQMITNMELNGMTDNNYDEIHVMWAVDRFLHREYKRNGEGGLFVIRSINRDLRDVEIWNQMCWYLDKIAK